MANSGEIPNGRPPRPFGLWISLALLIIGIGIGGIGGWRLVGSLYDEATQKPIKVIDIEPGVPITVTDLQVDATRKMQLAVQLRLPDSDDFSASVNYQFPYRYQLLQTGGGTLFEQQGSVASDQGLRISRQIDQQQGNQLQVEHRFRATQIPFPGLIDIEFLLEPASATSREPLAVSLLVYEGVSTDVRGVIIGASLVLLGSLVGLVGLILVLVHGVGRNKTSPNSDPAEADDGLESQDRASDSQARNLAMWCHLSAFSGFIVPFGNVLGPLVIWLTQRDKSPFIDQQGKEAVNFQLSLLVYSAVCALLVLVLVGILLLMALALGAFALTIIAAIQANQGVAYRYPLIIRFIR